MKFLILSFVALFSVKSVAGIETGKFAGTSDKGVQCLIEVISYSYENNVKHPLNEKVHVNVEGQEWTVKHPAVITIEEGKVRFDHNFFEAVVPTSVGANFLQMTINHDVEPHAPTTFTLIEDNYRDSTKSVKTVCRNLAPIQ